MKTEEQLDTQFDELERIPCWVVRTCFGDEIKECDNWLKENPTFTEWGDEEFCSEFVKTGLLLLKDGGDPMCDGPLFLFFKTEEAVKLYASRAPLVASGLIEPEHVELINAGPLYPDEDEYESDEDEYESDDDFEGDVEVFHEWFWNCNADIALMGGEGYFLAFNI